MLKEYRGEELSIYETMDIDVNGDDVSDVIQKDEGFTNITANIRSEKLCDVIREGRRFIVFDKNSIREGYYVYLNDSEDLAVLVIVDFESGKWIERSRRIIAGGENIWKTYNKYDGTATIERVDICGQAAVADVDNVRPWNYSVLGKHRIAKLVGDIFCLHRYVLKGYYEHMFCYGKSCVPDGIDKIEIINKALSALEDNEYFYSDKITIEQSDGKCIAREPALLKVIGKEDLDIPKDWALPESDIFDKMKKDFIATVGLAGDKRKKNMDEFAVLQLYEGNLICRLFRIDFDVVYPFAATDVKLIEYRRMLIDDKVIFLYSDIMTVYCDDLSRTKFKYICEPVMQEVEAVKKAFEQDYSQWKEVQDWVLQRYTNVREILYGARGYKTSSIYMMLAMQDGWIEKIVKKYKENLRFVWDLAASLYNYSIENYGKDYSCITKAILYEMFGEINEDAKTLHEFLMIQKDMLDSINKKEGIDVIRDIKYILEDDSLKSYMMRMNREDAKMLVDFLLYTAQYMPDTRDKIRQCFKFMLEKFGAESWKDYKEYLLVLAGEDCGTVKSTNLHTYYNYISCLLELERRSYMESSFKVIYDRILKSNGWKIKARDIEKHISYIEGVCEFGSRYTEILESFEKRQEEWEKYRYEYRLVRSALIVVPPKTPEEVVIEGIALRHCAKTFVEKIAKGETIIVFIRRKEEPDKPFYTMEIRGDRVRQVHGFDNYGITYNNSLMRFLSSFCRDKGLSFDQDEISELYGA